MAPATILKIRPNSLCLDSDSSDTHECGRMEICQNGLIDVLLRFNFSVHHLLLAQLDNLRIILDILVDVADRQIEYVLALVFSGCELLASISKSLVKVDFPYHH